MQQQMCAVKREFADATTCFACDKLFAAPALQLWEEPSMIAARTQLPGGAFWTAYNNETQQAVHEQTEA